MPTTPVRLEIDHYSVKSVHLDANLDYDDEKPSMGGIDVDFGVYPTEPEPPTFHVTMTIDIADDKPANEPYALHLELGAFFHFKPDTPTEVANKMLFSNAVPILYGIARGCVGQITGTALNGPLMLPPFNFVELMQRKHDAYQQERASADTVSDEPSPPALEREEV